MEARRGASAYEPEKAPRAIRKAVEMGVHAVGIYARVTKGGHVVVIHDGDLARVAGESPRASERGRVGRVQLGRVLSRAGRGPKRVEERAVLSLGLGEVSATKPAPLDVKPVDAIARAEQLGCRFHPAVPQAMQKAAGFAHKLGLRVVAWTVNGKEMVRRLFERGVDGVTTDAARARALGELEGLDGLEQ